MYLFDLNTYVKQLLPPIWRTPFKESALKVLCKPLDTIYLSFVQFRRERNEAINLNGQVLVLDYLVKRICESGKASVGDTNNGIFTLFLPKEISPEKEVEVKKNMEKYSIAGSQYKIEKI